MATDTVLRFFNPNQSPPPVVGSCARCFSPVTSGRYCSACIQLARLETDYEQSLERRSDCGSLDGGEL